ncbi:MAG: F0F1 ATP synthase subunit B [Nitrospirae bacterium]|nr:F0F1 ATP synthase subunit B [Nitrospirota bacterium]
MLEFNKWFFVQLINFLLLIVLLNNILFKPLLRLFKERQEKTKGDLDGAKAMDKEKEDLLNKINAQLVEARNGARATTEYLKKEGLNVQKELIDAAQKDAAGIGRQAQEKLNAEVRKTKEALRKEVEDLSNKIVEKLVGA